MGARSTKPAEKLRRELKALNTRIKKAGTVAEVMEAIAVEIGKPKEPPAPKKRKPKKKAKPTKRKGRR